MMSGNLVRYGRKLRRNAARCRACDRVIESKSVHDYVECSCGALVVEGGLEYIRRGCHGGAGYDELSEYEDNA